MENTNNPRAVYNTKRRTPSARGKSWAGTLLVVFTLPALIVMVYVVSASRGSAVVAFLIPAVMLGLGIFFWVRSGIEQNGTISFYDNKIVHKCRNEVFELLPGQISSVSQSGNVVKIVFSGKTLTFVSNQASMITQNINAFIAAYVPGNAGYAVPAAPVAQAAPVAPAPAAPVVDKAEEIRKYKQLVDDGVISQEQFDAIIKKMM